MALKKRDNTWYVYYKQDGRIVWRSLGTGDIKEAERHAEAIMAQVHEIRRLQRIANAFPQPINLVPASTMQTPPVLPAVQQTELTALPPPSVMQYSSSRFPLAKLYEIAERHRKLTESHSSVWQNFIRRCGMSFADEVTPQAAQKYMDAYYNGKSAKTYNNVRSALDMIFRSALIEAGLQSSPFSALLQRRLDDVEHYRPFTREETKAILGYLSNGRHEYWRCLTMISLYTGLRLESCKRLSPSHIKDGMITILPGKTARFGRAVQIPLLPPLQKYLGTLEPELATKETPYCSLFPEELRWARNVWFYGGMCESLGIRDTDDGKVSFHSLRVTFVTRLSEQGVEDRVIRGIVGHSSQQMTDLYNHDSESARKAMQGITMA